MARLTSSTLLALILTAGGCSLLYDADSLYATLEGDSAAPADGDTAVGPDMGEDAAGDAEVTADAADPVDIDTDGADETLAPGDTADADALRPGDVSNPDLTPEDTSEPDASPGDTALPDTGPEPVELVLKHTGRNGCVLDYYLQFLTSCPKTCGWRLEVDAAASTGVQTFAWRFSATNGYVVSPEVASGPTPSLSVGFPACALLGGSDVAPARVLIEVALNGGPFELVSSVEFGVRMVSSCPSGGQAACPHP